VRAGITAWPSNALRHSFASYYLAHFQDAARLALELETVNGELQKRKHPVFGAPSLTVGTMQPVVPSRWRSGLGRIDGAWNSIPIAPAPQPYVVHFPGEDLESRPARTGRPGRAAAG